MLNMKVTEHKISNKMSYRTLEHSSRVSNVSTPVRNGKMIRKLTHKMLISEVFYYF